MTERKEILRYNLSLLKHGLYNPNKFSVLVNEFEQTIAIYPKHKITAWLFTFNDKYEDFPVNMLSSESELLEVCSDLSSKMFDDEIRKLRVK